MVEEEAVGVFPMTLFLFLATDVRAFAYIDVCVCAWTSEHTQIYSREFSPGIAHVYTRKRFVLWWTV